MYCKELSNLISTPNESIIGAMKIMDMTGYGILFILEDEKLVGTLTDGDVRRWLIKTGELKCRVDAIMNKSPISYRKGSMDEAFKYMVAHKIKALPIIDDAGKLIDVIFNNRIFEGDYKSDALKNIPIVIMAGGKGTRLYPYTKILPKPLIPIGDIPIIDRIMDSFNEYGADEFLIIVNFMKNMIKAYENEAHHDYSIKFIDEAKSLGTAGGLQLLDGYFNNTFILTNCDTLIDEDFNEIISFHKKEKNDITLICALKTLEIPYGVIRMGDNGVINEMDEKPDISYFTNTGCYLVEPSVIKHIRPNECVGFPEIINRVKMGGGKVKAYPIGEQAWMDMGQIDSLESMVQILRQRNKL